MGERSYGVTSRRRSPSPRRPPPPRSRDFNPSRHRRYSPYNHRGREDYSKEAQTSRRTGRRDTLDRDFNLRAPRFSEYDNRDRDRYLIGARRSRSPQRIEKRDNFDGDVNRRPARFSDYEDRGKGKYENEVGPSRTSLDEDPYLRDLSSTNFEWGHHLDGPRKSDHLNMKDYSHTRDYNRDGYVNIPTGGGERDYYYSDSVRAGLLPASQFLDSTKPLSQEYGRGGRMNSHSYTLARGGDDGLSLRNFSGGDGSSHISPLASRYLNTDTEKQGYFHFRDGLHLGKRDVGLRDQEDRIFEKKKDTIHFQDGLMGVGKMAGREIYKFKEEEDFLPSRGFLKEDSDYMVSSSHPKDYVPSYSASGNHHMPAHVIGKGSGFDSQPIGFDGYNEKKQDMFPREPGGLLDDTRSSSRLYTGRAQEKQGDQLFAEFGRGKVDTMNARLDYVEEEYRGQHMSRINVLNPNVDETLHKKHTMNDGLWDPYPFPQVRSTPDKFEVRKRDLDMLGTGGSRLNYGTGGYSGYGSFKPDELHAGDSGVWSHLERSDILQSKEYDLSFGRLHDSPRKRSALADLSMVEPSERTLRHRHVRDERLYEREYGIRISTDGNGARKIYNQVDMGDEIDLFRLSKKPKPSKYNYKKTWRASRDIVNDQPSSSNFDPSRLVKPHKSDFRDIKKRLGPVPRKLHVSERLVKKYKPSIKKRLAPAPPMKRSALPWLKNQSSKQMVSAQEDSNRSHQDLDGSQLGDHITLAKPEPPEKSEDFKQLVQSAFFKFLKLINETPAKRKKYMEKGKAGDLKCILCGSNSEDFVETESLAMHAFTSKKAGLRSQHLGLHKALCVLMGWKIPENLSGEWRCEQMPNSETSALKEDIIIWPPVVIVHNSTIDNKNPNERVIVSTEKLDMNLRDMGFGSIVKVCNGKPANQSVMLVKFNGTLSGLQEAERFHNSYVESKRGRAELEQLKFKKTSFTGGTQEISAAERGDNFLYGHLGIAEDVDKLDFDTKKRCVLRSKKEILSIVDAPLETTDVENG